jgi:cyclase
MKIRVIPTILTDGLTVVKGQNFNNWRTIGSAEAVARLFGSRNVDELLFLDVSARSRGTTISPELLNFFSNLLDVPFSVGGGICTLKEASACFQNGAEKVVIGTSAVENSDLITEISEVYGSQAVIVSIDLSADHKYIYTHSGKKSQRIDFIEFAKKVELLGAGEILLQSFSKEGTMTGYDLRAINLLANSLEIPVIASSGAGALTDFRAAVNEGASAVAAGAFFQFTENTPTIVRNFLHDSGIKVRVLT